ncbi:GNAT family N-acetyltransferase [Halobellus rufus]|uniref:GNAT family N-acetyltransferase n=1 Tax=Halobellus rufus TaxID=1448860 RepID=UPI00067976C4|nr:GNAT family N-acetyltransferase [Halobellus rufus]
MSIDVRPLEDDTEWNSLVDRADGSTPFHRREALDVFADHTDTTLYPLVGYKGQEPVGLFPVFELRKGPLSAAFSPPPGRKIPYLGPVVFRTPGVKQRTHEKTHRRFVDSAIDYLDEEIRPRYVNVRPPPSYHDPRPFLWAGFEATPRYTYHVDIDRPADEVLSAASSDLRSNVRKTAEGDYQIDEAGRPEITNVIEFAQARHAEQGISYGVTTAFASDLASALPEHVAAYVCTAAGEFAGGAIVLVDDDALYRWQSVVDFEAPVPAHDLLDWHLIESGIDRGVDRYDLVGANEPRLCEYKSKFAPEVATYYELTRSPVPPSLVAAAYDRLR